MLSTILLEQSNATDACGKFDSTKKYTFIDNPLLIIGYEYVIFTIILDFK